MALKYNLDRIGFGTNLVQPMVRPKIIRAKKRCTGFAAALLGGFVYLLSGVAVQLSERIPALQFLFIQCSFGALVMLAVLRCTNQPFFGPPKAQFYVLVRSLLGGLSMCLFFLALQWLPLAHAVSLFAANTAIAYLNNWVVLEEPLRLAHVFSIILGLLGTMFMLRSGSTLVEPGPYGVILALADLGNLGSTTTIPGLTVAMLSALTAGLQLAPQRQAELFNASRTSIAFAQFVSGALCALLVASLVPDQEFVTPALDLKEVILVLVAVCAGLVFEVCSIYSAERVEEQYRSTLTSFQIVWAWAWQIAFFHDMSDMLMLLGSAVMFISVGVSCFAVTQDIDSSVVFYKDIEHGPISPRPEFHLSSQHTTLHSNELSSTYSSREFHPHRPWRTASCAST